MFGAANKVSIKRNAFSSASRKQNLLRPVTFETKLVKKNKTKKKKIMSPKTALEKLDQALKVNMSGRNIQKLSGDMQKNQEKEMYKDSRLRLFMKDKVYISTPERERQKV